MKKYLIGVVLLLSSLTIAAQSPILDTEAIIPTVTVGGLQYGTDTHAEVSMGTAVMVNDHLFIDVGAMVAPQVNRTRYRLPETLTWAYADIYIPTIGNESSMLLFNMGTLYDFNSKEPNLTAGTTIRIWGNDRWHVESSFNYVTTGQGLFKIVTRYAPFQ
jgi:hypothetical protein